MNTPTKNKTVTIILSPHYDDAVLSLGGLLASTHDQKVVATFFTEAGEIATSTQWDGISGFKNSTEATTARIAENKDSLKILGAQEMNYSYMDSQYRKNGDTSQIESDLTKDIQALISSFGTSTINVYGPAVFTKAITHPDHELVHNAFLDVAQNYPGDNVRFFIYEDYPYVERFNKEEVISLQKNLENNSGLYFTKIEIPLTSANVDEKINTLIKYTSQIKAFTSLKMDILQEARNYTNSRCESSLKKPCEVVYGINR